MNIEATRDQLVESYGDGSDGAVPRPDQWEHVLKRDPDQALTLINFFKFRETADYDGKTRGISGGDAFDQYAAVSMPTMERVGGKFLIVAPFEGVIPPKISGVHE